MRKVSKTRAEDADEVVSSTNGSVMTDDQADTNKPSDDEADKSDNDRDNKNQDSDYNADDKEDDAPIKKAKGKRGRKKKSEKASKSDKKSDSEEEYEVDKVVDSKKIKGKLHYLIRWKGYSADSDTWEPEDTLSCPELINKFNDEKENSKNSKDSDSKASSKKGRKRKADKKESKQSKKAKTEWDSENADEGAEYEVERILEVHHKKNGKREFLIHWKGWSPKFDSWEPESNLNCSELINKFMEKVDAARSTDSRNLRVSRETTNRFTLQDPSSGRRLSKRRGQRQRVRYDDAE